MMKQVHAFVLLTFVFYTSCKGQNKTELPKDFTKLETKDVITSYGPNSITRTLIQDRNGNIWIAAFDGIFRYDGDSFTNMTSNVSSSRFFSVLEDRKGNLWFGSIGSGVYYFDGKRFQNFTTKDGLPNNEVGCIYEDKAGNIWFGANGGVSRYDGRSFRNYFMNGDLMSEDKTGKTFPDFTRPPNEVTSIIEDKTGKLWFATRGNTFVYDARLNDEAGQEKVFTVFTNNGKPLMNVRTLIEDKKGNIWFGGNDGLWRFDGSTFTNFTQNFVGYIYEDKKGNIWTSSEENFGGSWALSRYDEKSLSDKKPPVTEVHSKERMIFGILEAYDGSIWFGTLNGVRRFDGDIIIDFKDNVVKE
jgi:ligand-binding sensor domain-containing protein